MQTQYLINIFGQEIYTKKSKDNPHNVFRSLDPKPKTKNYRKSLLNTFITFKPTSNTNIHHITFTLRSSTCVSDVWWMDMCVAFWTTKKKRSDSV